MMKNTDYQKAIKAEVEHWPGVEVEIVEGGKHPAAKIKFGGKMLKRPFAGTPSDSAFGIHQMLGDMRRTMKQLGARRDKPEPSREEDEAPYRKPNDGAAKRPPAVKGEPAKVKPDVADQLVSAGGATAEQASEARAQRVVAAARSTRAILPLDDATAAALGETPDEREARRAAIKEAAAAVVDGIYFGMPDAIYHSVARLSSSAVQRLCVSPATFWRGSWLDPDAPELDEYQTAAQLLGKAYHCARLEPDRFHEAYCRKPEKADYEGQDLITSDAAVKAALKEAGETQSIGTESNVERAQRLVDDCGEDRPIWALIIDQHERERGGRVPIEGRHFDQIIQDMQRVRGQSEVAELLVDGAAEVSVFWTDEHGLKMKCRFDYLTPSHWADFKTFDNSRGKVLEQALADAVRFNRYYVQAVIYRDGSEAVRTGGLQIIGEANDAQRALIAGLQIRPDELACWFVFQEKKGIPNLLAVEFPFYDVPITTFLNSAGATEEQIGVAEAATRTRSGLFARGSIDVRHAKDQFVLYANAYDPGTPWFPLNAKRRFSDLDFNSYWLEGKD